MSNSREPNPGGRSSRRLNPQAMDFSPAARTSSKRKASPSAKSALSSNASSPPESMPTQAQVHIDAEQLLGPDSSPSLGRADSAEDWSDFEELEDALFGPGARRFPPMATQINRRARHEREQQGSYRASNVARQSQRPAILLIQAGGPAGSSLDSTGRVAGQLPYLPLYQHSSRASKGDLGMYAVLPSHANRILRAANDTQASPTTTTWPGGRIPVELFELIAGHLTRDDIKSMRLVSKEFEQKVCRSLFSTAVVPFNTELYDMIVDETKTISRGPLSRYKGRGEMKTKDGETELWGWRNAKEDKDGKVYQGHGLRVFQGFGPYIRRFGMSFEVVESQLSSPPGKQLLDPVDSYHGTYEWPTINYARFANLNRLEETADETSRMKSAFSNLTVVSELALSMRNGLGWLEGPDKSFRTHLLQHQGTVFGNSYGANDRVVKSARDVMSCLRQSFQRVAPGTSFKELILDQHTLHTPLDKIFGLHGTCFADTRLWPTLEQGLVGRPHQNSDIFSTSSPLDGFEVLCAHSELAGAARLGEVDLNPSELKKEQKEWLLETGWAQRAFLESYMLAVMDNPAVFSQVKTLNLATVSSGLLPMISRRMFWDALPSLYNVIIHVSPDWRTVHKDEAGVAETKLQTPSEAVRGFFDLLKDQLSWREHITKLNIGWADGGENAQGLYARNANVLPAPLSLLDQSIVINPTDQLVFPHLEHLTLSNCWITPPVLERMVKTHAGKALKKLTLDSVSLTSHPQPPTPAQQAQAAAAAAVIHFQAQHNSQINHAALHAHAQGQLQQAMAQQQVGFIQHFQSQMQNMQQLFNNPGAALPAPPNPFAVGPPVLPLPAALLANGNQSVHFGANNPPPHPPQPNTSYWTDNHRQGCWPDLLSKVSPGPDLSDYLPAPQPWEEQRPPRPSTNLQSIELISCGYIALEHNATFDQTALMATIDPGRERAMTPWFRARWLALRAYMLDASGDKFLGSIVQCIPQRELDAMRYAWGLRVGWRDREKAEEAEFDGYRPGGTGRVSGVIEKGMPLMTQHLPDENVVTPPAQTSAQAAGAGGA